MNATRHFVEEMQKLAFSVKAPPVLSSIAGKTTKGVVAKPQTSVAVKAVKTPVTQINKNVPSLAPGRIGTKINPAKAETPPPAPTGGTNVR